jgi:transcription initiation factor TFIIB
MPSDKTQISTKPAAQKERQPPEKTTEDEDVQSKTQDACEECGGSIREDEQRGESVCEDCGLVAGSEAIDRGPEWRAFSRSERNKKSRVGSPTTKMMHDDGLSTNISWQDKDAYGSPLSSRQRKKMQRLRTWNERFRTKDSKERNLKQALSEIQRMGSALGLNDQVQETASVIYRRCLDENLLPGRSIEGVATASLYAASRQCNTPRSLGEIYPVSRITTTSNPNDSNDNRKEIDRTYRYITRELNLKMEPVDPRQYLNRYINQLDFENPRAIERRARKILKDAEQANVHSGKSPTGLSAAAIYAASLKEKDKTTQKRIADVAETTQVTIRNRYQEMLEVHQSPAKPA